MLLPWPHCHTSQDIVLDTNNRLAPTCTYCKKIVTNLTDMIIKRIEKYPTTPRTPNAPLQNNKSTPSPSKIKSEPKPKKKPALLFAIINKLMKI